MEQVWQWLGVNWHLVLSITTAIIVAYVNIFALVVVLRMKRKKFGYEMDSNSLINSQIQSFDKEIRKIIAAQLMFEGEKNRILEQQSLVLTQLRRLLDGDDKARKRKNN